MQRSCCICFCLWNGWLVLFLFCLFDYVCLSFYLFDTLSVLHYPMKFEPPIDQFGIIPQWRRAVKSSIFFQSIFIIIYSPGRWWSGEKLENPYFGKFIDDLTSDDLKQIWILKTMGVFLVTTRISIVPVKHNFSMNTDSWISTIPRGSERSGWASPWTARASGALRNAVERMSRVSGMSERT